MPLTLFIMNEGQLCKHTSDQANITRECQILLNQQLVHFDKLKRTLL